MHPDVQAEHDAYVKQLKQEMENLEIEVERLALRALRLSSNWDEIRKTAILRNGGPLQLLVLLVEDCVSRSKENKS